MDRSKRIVGIALIAVSIIALVVWEKWGREKFIYDEVLVLKENIERGSVIDEDSIKVIKSGEATRDALRPEDREWLIGKESAQFIHKSTLLYKEYFRSEGLVSGEKLDRYVIRIGESWVENMPQGLKSGDTAIFYCEGKEITRAAVCSVNEDKRSFEAIMSGSQSEQISEIASSGRKFVISYC